MLMDLERKSYKESRDVLAYKDFAQSLGRQKFDFIAIDAPFGYSSKIYARVDVLGIIPECLAESFCIMIDDYNRKGEQNMAKEMRRVLAESGIAFAEGVYAGEKQCLVLTSANNRFLTSM